jgi:4-amino-4-deoxy-L-arabinose transferase-like glycosyltransferase
MRRYFNLHALFLLLVLAVAAIPRAVRMTGGLEYDETFASSLKLAFSRSGIAWIFYDTHPPLYNFMMLLWNHVFGESELSLRVFPFLCSLAAILVAAAIARELLGRTEALIVAVLMALSGGCAYYAHEARSYSFMVLLFLLAVLCLLRYRRTAEGRELWRFVALSFLCSISHVYSLVFILCLAAALMWRASGPRNIVAIVRIALLQVVLAVPFYFCIVLMTVFTKEHAYLSNFTERFSGPQIAEVFSFYLFGYAGLNRYWPIHVFALALFLFGLIVLLRRLRTESSSGDAPPSSPHDFSFPGMNGIFTTAVALGLTVSAALAAFPLFLPPDLFRTLIPSQEHAALMARMVSLISRTAILYLLGYAGAAIFWRTIGTPAVRTWLESLATSRNAKRVNWSGWTEAILLFPIVAFIPVVILSRLSPSYNARYMLVLAPFVLMSMATALTKIPSPGLRYMAVALLAGAQAYSFTGQEPAYALHKPDNRTALQYLYETGRSYYPVASTAPWVTENLSKYYARRFQKPELQLVPISEISKLPDVSLLVPDMVPLSLERFTGLRQEIQTAAHVKEVRFSGVTLYEFNRRTP